MQAVLLVSRASRRRTRGIIHQTARETMLHVGRLTRKCVVIVWYMGVKYGSCDTIECHSGWFSLFFMLLHIMCCTIYILGWLMGGS